MYCKIFAMKKIILILFGLFISFSCFAQSADVITDLLEKKEVTFGQICYITAVQKQLVDENATYEAAVQALVDNKIIPGYEDPEAPIPLVDIVYLYSKLWPIKGGLMYRITKGSPRYVFKQFQSDGILTGKQEPSDIISGAKALSIYTSCINKYSDFNIRAVSMESE